MGTKPSSSSASDLFPGVCEMRGSYDPSVSFSSFQMTVDATPVSVKNMNRIDRSRPCDVPIVLLSMART